MDLEGFRELGNELYNRLHLPTYPVAIKFIKSEDEIPKEAIRPSAGNQKWSLCQAFTYARRMGLHSAMTDKDNFCVPSSASMGWIDVPVEELFESQIQQGWHKNRAAEQCRFDSVAQALYSGPEGQERLNKMRQYVGFICSPLTSTIVIPDSVLVYGDGGHTSHLIQALCYDYTEPITSSFDGFGESCFKGGLLPFITGKPQVVIPGMGDRAFSGTTVGEMAVGIPGPDVVKVNEYLFKTGGHQNMGYPLKGLLATGLTESITPGFKYLRDVVDKQKNPS
ncbi:MAG: DUF169 domain-containing protein [Deltaproteobacteria bacterium]|nr:DUF169 domain-containing protein [Deltaproteobacteria bacterium]